MQRSARVCSTLAGVPCLLSERWVAHLLSATEDKQAYQQLKKVEAVEGSRAHKRRLQEALLDDRMCAQLVQQCQGGEGHTHEAPTRTALPLIEGLLVCSLPAQYTTLGLNGKFRPGVTGFL